VERVEVSPTPVRTGILEMELCEEERFIEIKIEKFFMYPREKRDGKTDFEDRRRSARPKALRYRKSSWRVK